MQDIDTNKHKYLFNSLLLLAVIFLTILDSNKAKHASIVRDPAIYCPKGSINVYQSRNPCVYRVIEFAIFLEFILLLARDPRFQQGMNQRCCSLTFHFEKLRDEFFLSSIRLHGVSKVSHSQA